MYRAKEGEMDEINHIKEVWAKEAQFIRRDKTATEKERQDFEKSYREMLGAAIIAETEIAQIVNPFVHKYAM